MNKRYATLLIAILLLTSLLACQSESPPPEEAEPPTTSAPMMDGAMTSGSDINRMEPTRGKEDEAPMSVINAEEDAEDEEDQEDEEEYKQESEERTRVLAIAIAYEPVSDILARFPDYQSEIYHEEGDIWGVDFYESETDEDEEEEYGEWLGYVSVNLAAEEVEYEELPHFLSEEEEDATRTQVEEVVLNDPEVIALLGDVNDWYRESEYDSYEQIWYVFFEKEPTASFVSGEQELFFALVDIEAWTIMESYAP